MEDVESRIDRLDKDVRELVEVTEELRATHKSVQKEKVMIILLGIVFIVSLAVELNII